MCVVSDERKSRNTKCIIHLIMFTVLVFSQFVIDWTHVPCVRRWQLRYSIESQSAIGMQLIIGVINFCVSKVKTL